MHDDESEEMYEKAINDLANLVSEEMRGHPSMSMEPFDAYAARIKAKIHADMNEFRTRFSRGYHALIKELEKEHPKHKEPPGPGAIRP
jgi:hypothetical protein